jgi:site-specific recombinase XerD
MRTDFVCTDTVQHILWALTPANKLVCEVALATGWRIDDILCLRSAQIARSTGKLTIKEKKTGKRSTKTVSKDLLKRLKVESGRLFVFEGRDDYRKHRTRQAVFQDLKRAAVRFNLKLNLSPHSLRKNYAVFLREQGLSVEEIRQELNHRDLAVTMIYCFSDELAKKYK